MAAPCCWGEMNWDLHPDWVCEFCGERSLLWAITNGEAHCQGCHAFYSMRDGDGKTVDIPVSRMKEEFAEAYRKIETSQRKPMNQMSADDWYKAGIKKTS